MSDGLLPRSEFFQSDTPVIEIKFKNDDYAFLREFFEYNPKTGEVIRIKAFQSRHVGKCAIQRCPSGKDSDVIFIKGRRYLCAWKVIYYLQKGVYLPNNYICEFVDGDKHNHKAENLRIITRSDKSHRENDFPNFGIFIKTSGKKYAVKIKRGGLGDTYLGSFNDEQQARMAYMNAKLEVRNSVNVRNVL